MIDDIIKTITRNIIPGLVFVLFVIYIPFTLFNPHLKATTIHPTIFVFLGITVGFVLDGMGAYRYTWKYRKYQALKSELSNQLSKELNPIQIKSTTPGIEVAIQNVEFVDPDTFIAEIWIGDHETYQRIMEERAEWVSILVSGFCFICAFFGTIFYLIFATIKESPLDTINAVIYGAICLIVSILLTQTGIKRMKAHNQKLLMAAKKIRLSRNP